MNHLLEFTLQSSEAVIMQSPIVSKTHVITEHLILSVKLFATDPKLEEFLDDEYYSELIV